MEDQKAGVENLVSFGFVDAARIGMWGWSYGGYMTLNTMLSEPKLIKANISARLEIAVSSKTRSIQSAISARHGTTKQVTKKAPPSSKLRIWKAS